jgi:hypothetical protein
MHVLTGGNHGVKSPLDGLRIIEEVDDPRNSWQEVRMDPRLRMEPGRKDAGRWAIQTKARAILWRSQSERLRPPVGSSNSYADQPLPN